jgi:predicted GIY-YIG superfamily endonuclease
MKSHVLYRFYSATGQLLYVGITNNPPERFRQHRDGKDWWELVSGMKIETYGSREELAEAERSAIQIEHPLYNVVYNRGKQHGLAIPVSRGLVHVCDTCHEPVDDGLGFLEVRYDDIDRHSRAWDEFYKELRPLSECPTVQRAHWLVHHDNGWCSPNHGGGSYWIDVERIRTREALIAWTAHLLGKQWLADTDWYQVLRSHVPDRL